MAADINGNRFGVMDLIARRQIDDVNCEEQKNGEKLEDYNWRYENDPHFYENGADSWTKDEYFNLVN